MDDYNKLLEELSELKLFLESRIIHLTKKKTTLQYDIRKINGEISGLEEDVNFKSYILNALNNYDNTINNEKTKAVKSAFKWSISLTILITLFTAIPGIITNNFMIQDIIFNLIIGSLVGSGIAGVRFFESTSCEREIKKDFGYQVNTLPLAITALKKKISVKKEIKKDIENTLSNLDSERNDVETDLELCNDYLLQIAEKLVQVSFICHNDVQTINEVYENDDEIQDVLKLVREKDTSKID